MTKYIEPTFFVVTAAAAYYYAMPTITPMGTFVLGFVAMSGVLQGAFRYYKSQGNVL